MPTLISVSYKMFTKLNCTIWLPTTSRSTTDPGGIKCIPLYKLKLICIESKYKTILDSYYNIFAVIVQPSNSCCLAPTIVWFAPGLTGM